MERMTESYPVSNSKCRVPISDFLFDKKNPVKHCSLPKMGYYYYKKTKSAVKRSKKEVRME